MDNERPYSQEMTGVARRLRRQSTSAERVLWNVLRDRRCHGHRFLRQVPAGQYILDFYCAAVRLVIEVDGGIHDRADVQARDVARDVALTEELGMTVLRLSNAEVLNATPGDLRLRITQAVAEAAENASDWAERPSRRR